MLPVLLAIGQLLALGATAAAVSYVAVTLNRILRDGDDRKPPDDPPSFSSYA